MTIADPLPEAVAARWRDLARPDEEVVLTVASDVTAGGDFGERWLVITNKRVVVLPGPGQGAGPAGAPRRPGRRRWPSTS